MGWTSRAKALPKAKRLIVVEGYMDVIALHQAGFDGAVAPLGTSLTDEHLGELWKLAPSPVLCFDGDTAGGKAAARAIEMALPMLAPDRTLRIVTLPNGEDPDSLVQHHGFAMFDHALHSAAPLSTALYHVMREQVGDATPEQRAMLRRRLEDAAKGIPDKGLATEYRRALLDRFSTARWRAARRSGSNHPRRRRPRAPPKTACASWRLSCCTIRSSGTNSGLPSKASTCRPGWRGFGTAYAPGPKPAPRSTPTRS